MPRCVFHVDMDAFYASVEMLDCPDLRGKPVLVGGTSPRSVVSAASYEARAYGVHSAMPMTQALRLCPEAVVRPVRFGRYRAVSEQIRGIFGMLTPIIEPLSLDEAYLEMTGWLPEGETAEAVALRLQQSVLNETGLTCSVGVATSKSVAKIASDLRKPHGMVIVPPGTEAAFLAPLPIGRLRGVGAVTECRLREWGIATIGDLAAYPEETLQARFGVGGPELKRMALGIDPSPVVPEREAKSIGREVTFATDVTELSTLDAVLLELAEDVAASLRAHHRLARGITLKLRDESFATRTRAAQLSDPTDLSSPLYETARALLAAVPHRRPTRLIGITATHLMEEGARQLNLFAEPETAKQRQLASTLDRIRARFGQDAIIRARLLKRDDHGE